MSNALFINGQLDPLRTIGVQNDDNNESVVVIVIEGRVFLNNFQKFAEASRNYFFNNSLKLYIPYAVIENQIYYS